MARELTDFIKAELNPALFERIDEAFPSMEFIRKGRKWESPYHINGNKAKDGAGSYVSERYSNRIADVNGSESLSLIDYKMIEEGEDFLGAVEALASVCGLQLPSRDTGEYKAYQERQDRLHRLQAKMAAALFKPEGADVLRYLKEERGYSEELCKKMGLGALTEDVATELRESKELFDLKGQQSGEWYNVWEYYRLSIPYAAGGTIKGFKFRSLSGSFNLPDGTKQPKYRNTGGMDKSSSFFGLVGTRLSGVGADKDVTIVEGDLDCLHAQAIGFPYCVACGGSSLSPEAVEELKGKGATKITLLYDTEDTAESQEETDKKIAKALSVIDGVKGVKAYVATLPAPAGEKMDVDGFLRSHTKEELSEVLAQAPSAIIWRQLQLLARYTDEGKNDIFSKDIDNVRKETIRLCNLPSTTPTDRALLIRNFETWTGGVITKEDFEAEADAAKAEADRATQERELKGAMADAQRMIGDGRTEDAIALLRDKAASLSRISREVEYRHYLTEDIDGLFEQYKTEPKGIETKIELSLSATEKYRFRLPSGALTIIGAPTGHGKSKMLQSLAIDAATDGGAGSVLYITYEENRKNVNRQLLNAFCNLELTLQAAGHGNEQTLQEYLYNGSTQYMRSGQREEFERRLKAYKELRKEKLILIKPNDNYLETLLGLLNYATRSGSNVKAVFIDYVQELYIEGLKRNAGRVDELKEICVETDLIAQRADVPIVLGAQLRRDTESPLSLSNQDIADSGWIERKASEILLLWSNKELPKNDTDEGKRRKVERELSALNIGGRGKLYAKLTKSRYIPTGASAILDINGNTGRVAGNASEEPKPQPEKKGKAIDTAALFGEGGTQF